MMRGWPPWAFSYWVLTSVSYGSNSKFVPPFRGARSPLVYDGIVVTLSGNVLSKNL